MELLQLREKEIFETLRDIRKHRFVVIGGYAVNAYTLPRFSVDCDIVVEDKAATAKIEKELIKINYVRATDTDLVPYHEDFLKSRMFTKGKQEQYSAQNGYSRTLLSECLKAKQYQ